MSHGGLYLSQTSNNVSAAASILSSTQGPTMSTANGSSHQQTQMGLTPQQKQEKLNLIRANSLQSNGAKFIKNQLSMMQKKQFDENNSNNEGSANDIILAANGDP